MTRNSLLCVEEIGKGTRRRNKGENGLRLRPWNFDEIREDQLDSISRLGTGRWNEMEERKFAIRPGEEVYKKRGIADETFDEKERGMLGM